MDREGFRNRLKQYKEAKGFDPLLLYWDWKLKYDSAPQPDKMPSQPQSDLPTPSSQHLDNRSHRWDNGYSNVNRDPFDSPYDDARYHDYRKPRFELRKGNVHYSNPNLLKWMGRFGKVLRGGSLLSETILNLFPSEEAELIEDLRVKMDKQNKQLMGLEDIPMYKDGTDEVHYAGMLPEVVVVPEKWQKDFSENFGDARIRRNVYRSMPTYTKVEDLQEERKKYYKLLKSGQFTEDSRKAFENKLDSLSNDYRTFVEDPNTSYRNVNDEIKRLYDVWNAANRPKITSKNSIFGDMFGFKTPHWNPVNNSIHNTANLSTIISELAHPIQYKAGDKNRLDDYLLGLPKAVYGRVSKHYNAYGDKNHYEYDTHSNIEPALREYISHGKNTKYLNLFAEGGEVTGPPTYEDWYKDITKPTLNAFDDVNLKVSMEEASADLHNMAMMLPGYAERWAEYQKSKPKEDPSIDQFVDNLWENENPNNIGYRNGKYYPHKSPEGGAMTIGPGFKLGSGSHRITEKQAKQGVTKYRLNKEAEYIGEQHLKAVNLFLNYGLNTNPADTVSPLIKMGLMDLRHLVGPLNTWHELRDAVLSGDLDKIKKESTVTWSNNGKTKVDKRRKKIRDEKYFYYE